MNEKRGIQRGVNKKMSKMVEKMYLKKINSASGNYHEFDSNWIKIGYYLTHSLAEGSIVLKVTTF